jgi:NitT/TauT family transport system substrate-binding protein
MDYIVYSVGSAEIPLLRVQRRLRRGPAIISTQKTCFLLSTLASLILVSGFRLFSSDTRRRVAPPASSPWSSKAARVGKPSLPVLLLWLATSVSGWAQGSPATIRVGAFPNITHAQAMVGKANGWFDKAMGSQVKIQWTSFNAGPSAIEALFAGAIDMTYVGPNPAINGYVRSNGEALRVVAGAASGGASLVVRNDSGIRKPEDFHGKRVASPQFGNTQDVALRNWLKKNGMKTTDKGGDVQIVPMANPDQLTLFLKKELDAAWAPEPWATRLIHEGNGRLLVDERTLWPDGQFVIGLLVVNTKFLKAHPDLVKNWIRAHVDLTDWINGHQPEAKKLLNQQIQAETGKALPSVVLDEAFSRMQVTFDPLHSALTTAAQQAFDDGFLGRQMPDLSHLYDLTLLNQVLAEKGRKAIP